MKKFKCIFCKGNFEGFGNNPAPLESKGKCCDTCNIEVIQARLQRDFWVNTFKLSTVETLG